MTITYRRQFLEEWAKGRPAGYLDELRAIATKTTDEAWSFDLASPGWKVLRAKYAKSGRPEVVAAGSASVAFEAQHCQRCGGTRFESPRCGVRQCVSCHLTVGMPCGE